MKAILNDGQLKRLKKEILKAYPSTVRTGDPFQVRHISLWEVKTGEPWLVELIEKVKGAGV